MLGALIIVFREVIEAGLIVGITMAVTRGIPGRGRYIGAGVAAGVIGACLVGAFINTISNAFQGVGQELFNAGILGVAVVMLAWHNVWMARHGREIAVEMRKAGEAVHSGASTLAGLAIVVTVAVLREGAEVALFLYGIFIASEPGSGTSLLAGGFIGLLLGGVVTVLTYGGLLRIPSRYIFGVTSVLIALLAAGLASQAVGFLQQADVVTALSEQLWDSSHILSDTSIVGRVLHTLIGYNDHPSAMQGLCYVATLAVIASLMKLFAHPVPAQARA
ncbi:high-affinity iron transporter [Rhizobiales bacterium GAS191]|nr:high-affinity iron transporter [Rhizobiales bacterium GAS113]SED45128.1 high-affinity iron transporter [Rhizobiales bacterium GAS188]SEE93167.1 high-affinity iron transporter [Rhizobiales bacterium GAS191]